MLNEFCAYGGATVTTAEALAEALAIKAKILSTFIARALDDDGAVHAATGRFDFNGNGDSELRRQFVSIREMLLRNLKTDEFADLYAQTIAYGMFAARWNDPSPHDFKRGHAAELIPRSNPFLRNLFGYVAGVNLDRRILWLVEALADILRATDLHTVLAGSENPVIHFYETFLSQYNPKIRKNRGVWYTPEPVVKFMVRAADELLQAEFQSGLEDNETMDLSDADKTTPKTSGAKNKVHKVQILDPATGTGAFLAEIVKQVQAKVPAGIWPDYVQRHLIPRLHGFELLMAPYTMAHLTVATLLEKSGAKPESRLRIYLTNALEGDNPVVPELPFANWISQEANMASQVKRHTPVMLVIGNPPYSATSANTFDWIGELVADYKIIDGDKLDEKNSKWLQDDYVKFIRLGEWLLERNETGILAYINNHSLLENLTFRGMRRRLLLVFDKNLFLICMETPRKMSFERQSMTKTFSISNKGYPLIFLSKREKSAAIMRKYIIMKFLVTVKRN